MTAPLTPEVRTLSCWQVPGLFSNVDGIAVIIGLGQSILSFLGTVFEKAGAYLKPIGSACKSVTGYLSATRVFTNIASWIPGPDGTVSALKTTGNLIAKGVSSVSFQLLNCIDTVLFCGVLNIIDIAKISENMGKIPVLGGLFKAGFTWLKTSLALIGMGASLVDAGFSFKNALSKMGSQGVHLDLVSGFTGRGWFKMEKDTPEAHKAKEEGGKELRDLSLGVLKNILKTAVIFLSIFGWAIHPVVGFLALTASIVTVGSTIIKGYDKKEVAYDPKHAETWKLARQLSTV